VRLVGRVVEGELGLAADGRVRMVECEGGSFFEGDRPGWREWSEGRWLEAGGWRRSEGGQRPTERISGGGVLLAKVGTFGHP
jgi:hypothetical protein